MARPLVLAALVTLLLIVAERALAGRFIYVEDPHTDTVIRLSSKLQCLVRLDVNPTGETCREAIIGGSCRPALVRASIG